MDAASASTEFSNRDPALRLIGLRESRVWGWVSPDGFGAPKSPPPSVEPCQQPGPGCCSAVNSAWRAEPGSESYLLPASNRRNGLETNSPRSLSSCPKAAGGISPCAEV